MRNLIAAAALALTVPAGAQTLSGAYGNLSSLMSDSRKTMSSLAAPAAANPAAPSIGDAAPDFILPGPSGSHGVGEYSGQVVVLEFWAGYSAMCRTGAPARVALAAKYASRRVVMLDIGVGESSSQVLTAAAAPATNEVQLFDADSSVFGKYGGMGVPMAVVVDQDGDVAAVIPGADAGRVEAAVRSALGL
jgi:peroxiredoxin